MVLSEISACLDDFLMPTSSASPETLDLKVQY